jgi:hypothetical protein
MTMRAGAARVSLEPPLGLPMVGFVRQWQTADGYGWPLEATALVLDSDGTRVALIGVDTCGIQSPEVDALRERVGAAIGAPAANVLLNWSHTHLAPPGSSFFVDELAQIDDPTVRERAQAYVEVMHDKVVSVARLAAEALEPARAVWGLGALDEAVNRRERTADGRVILGWHPDGLVDQSVPVLQLRRPDESAVCTVVGYGCHTVIAGPDVTVYSSDYAGPLRAAVRDWTGGECVFFQGAAGNVLSRVCFTESEVEPERVGRALALEALHAVSKRSAWPHRFERSPGGSVTPFSLYRRANVDAGDQALAAAEERVVFPLLPLPSAEEIAEQRAEFERIEREAEEAGEGPGRLRTLAYNTRWARRTEAQIAAGTAPTEVEASLSAIRVGDGAIVTAPGEIFSEIGLAVKERSPAEVTLYAGYTNGILSYFPIASEYPLGGYEPGYGNRSFGLPSQVTPEADRALVETGARLAAALFPERAAPNVDGWLATGALPQPPAADRPERQPDPA